MNPERWIHISAIAAILPFLRLKEVKLFQKSSDSRPRMSPGYCPAGLQNKTLPMSLQEEWATVPYNCSTAII